AAFPSRIKQPQNRFPHNIAIACFAALTFTAPAQQPTAQPTNTTAEETLTTPSEELTDNDWQNMSASDRRQRWRQRTIRTYLPDGGNPSLADVQQYVDKFGEVTVFDPRYYLYKVTATAIPDTTGSVKLSGEVYPAHYLNGVA